MIRLDSILDILWVLLCTGALLSHWTWKPNEHSSRSRMRRTFALFLIAVSLFPSLSATDDLLRLKYLEGSLHAHQSERDSLPQGKQETPTTQLVRMLEVLDAYQVTGYILFSILVFFIALCVAPVLQERERLLPAIRGRAPPSFSPAV